MATKQRSIAGVAKRAKAADDRARLQAAKDVKRALTTDSKEASGAVFAMDSFINFAQKLGVGADNALSSGTYGFNPITRQRVLLEWIHRGSWLGGVAVDIVAEDMTRAGVEMLGDIDPKDIAKVEEAVVSLGVWNSINDALKWSRLYGGAVAVMMIDGQQYHTPLRIETIGKGQFKGLMVFDRWMLEPSLNDLVTDPGPDMGLPKLYTVTSDAPALNRLRIHHSRCIRLEGIRLPYWQRMTENLWGESVIERLFDRMVAYDSASTGAAQLVYKAYIRTYKIKGLRQVIAAGGKGMDGMVRYVEMMRKFQGIEGMTLMDMDDDFGTKEYGSFAGLSDVLAQFGQQLAGALQIPLVRLFGMSPQGFQTGDTDLRMYYDSINQQQNKTLKVGMTRVYRAASQSEGVTVPEGFGIKFRQLWQMTAKEKSEVANNVADAVTKAQESGLISDQTALKELKQSSVDTGVFTNITQEDINAAEDEPAPRMEMGAPGMGLPGEEGGIPAGGDRTEGAEEPSESPDKAAARDRRATRDSVRAIGAVKQHHDLDVVIESPKGSYRSGTSKEGTAWRVKMPTDYGYIRRAGDGGDGEPLDCHVGGQWDSGDVWVIHQQDPDTRDFDEYKVMLGFPSMNKAVGTYLSAYTDGRAWGRIKQVQHLSMEDFKKYDWMRREA